jgi:ArsR family transcriptional regulator
MPLSAGKAGGRAGTAPARDPVAVFKALADGTRLRILLLLLRQDLCVCELVYALDMEQSRVSHQMKVLRDAGLVTDTRQGRWIIYGLPAGVPGFLEGFFGPDIQAVPASLPEAERDARRLAEGLSKNIRARVCDDSRPGREGKATPA